MIGYRDNGLFGDGWHFPMLVAYYETQELGNTDIPEHILNHFSEALSEKERLFLQDIVDGNVDEIDKIAFGRIIDKIRGEKDTCLWLCRTPEDVYNSYVASMQGNDISYEEYRQNITAYEIPNDSVVLADNGSEGVLYCFKQEQLRELPDETLDEEPERSLEDF